MAFTTDTDIQLTRGIRGGVNGTPIPLRFGATSHPAGRMRLFNGTAANQANVAFEKTFSLTAASNLDVDFTTGQTDVNGQAVNLSAVKLVYLEITSATTGDSLRLGPQNVTNGWQGWFGTTTTTGYAECRGLFLQGGYNFAGWTVDGTHKVLRLNNPSATTVSGYLWVVGKA
jgi:hypothetical protein